jgi:hypothetical protein
VSRKRLQQELAMMLFVFERCGSPCKLGGVERVGLNRANRANRASTLGDGASRYGREHKKAQHPPLLNVFLLINICLFSLLVFCLRHLYQFKHSQVVVSSSHLYRRIRPALPSCGGYHHVVRISFTPEFLLSRLLPESCRSLIQSTDANHSANEYV